MPNVTVGLNMNDRFAPPLQPFISAFRALRQLEPAAASVKKGSKQAFVGIQQKPSIKLPILGIT